MGRKSSAFLALLLSLAVGLVAGAQDLSLGLRVAPQSSIPLSESASAFGLGWGARAELLGNVASFPLLNLTVDVGYVWHDIQAEASLSAIRANAGIVVAVPFASRFSAEAYASAGVYTGLLHGGSNAITGGLSARVGGAFSLFLSPRIGIDILVGYATYRGLFQGIEVAVSTTTRLAGRGGGPIPSDSVRPLLEPQRNATGFLRFAELRLQPVFPVLLKYYDTHPIGTARVKNISEQLLTDVAIRADMEQYVDNPKLSARIDRLRPGEEVEVELYVLFNDRVLTITEGVPLAAVVRAEYRVEGRSASDAETVTLQLYDRNALRWDDDAKIAAFVTAKDDEVQRFAKNLSSAAQESQRPGLSTNLQLGAAAFAGLRVHGLAYRIDPASSYIELSRDRLAVDYVQFPRQTLQFKAGDCDDLSATYNALLEAIGVPTAFVTTPGHIFSAFRLEMSAAEARRIFASPDDLIYPADGSAWVPVETTALTQGFIEAWVIAARQWREHSAAGRAGFMPTTQAWATYQPVSFGVTSFQIEFPAAAQIQAEVSREIARVIGNQIYDREQQLLAALSAQDGAIARNRLGVLYARYGLHAEAKEQFEAALWWGDYAPALVNLGNLEFLASRMREAIAYFERALARKADDAAALAGLARAHHNLENYGEASRYYQMLDAADHQVAVKYGYLRLRGEEAARSTDLAGLSTIVDWDEER